MKKIFNLALLLLCSVSVFTACEDDRDSNPVLVQPTEFVLNQPTYTTGSVIDLKSSSNFDLTWSQPVYTTGNAPVVATYDIQFSPTDSYSVSMDEADADKSGTLTADYVAYGQVKGKCQATISASSLKQTLVRFYKWASEADVPETLPLYFRVIASVNGRDTIISNSVQVTVKPQYVELTDAAVEIWYLVGGCIGDGTWTNNGVENIGTSLIPLSVVEDAEYDKSTGQGVLTYTGYFTTDGFKLIKTPGSWTDQWGMSGGYVKNDGGSGNITVASDGYYTVTLDTKNDVLTIVKADITPTVYEGMCVSGDFNNWSDNAMTPVNTLASYAGHNHIWLYEIDATGGATTCKFKIPNSWATNWGNSYFPNGVGVADGPNIPVSQGKWRVIFNDITGNYNFVEE